MPLRHACLRLWRDLHAPQAQAQGSRGQALGLHLACLGEVRTALTATQNRLTGRNTMKTRRFMVSMAEVAILMSPSDELEGKVTRLTRQQMSLPVP